MVYKSSFSKQMLTSTIVFIIIFAAALVYMIYQLTSAQKWSISSYIIICAFILVCAALLHGFCSQIRQVELTESSLSIHKMCGSIHVPLKDITDINRKTSPKYDVRLFAIGGLFGYIGQIRGNDCGRYQAFINNGDNAFYFKTKDGKCYAASCDNVNQLIAAVKQQLH